MAETSSNASVNPTAGKPRGPAAKDKKCPFCQQPFTSSSLGRHLDLYIKDRNPKAPDGVHDVEAIRRLRGNITRRQARGSLGGSSRGQSSTPAATPTAASRRSVAPSEGGNSSTMVSPVDRRASLGVNRETTQIISKYPFVQPWQQTGVINNIPGGESSSRAGDDGDSHPTGGVVSQQQARVVSRQALKAQFEMKHKLQDAQDTARAAELALRELVSSWRAAKLQIDMTSMPFDFDPLALDFPALTLRCLSSPPTVFSSTQIPSPTSWSVSPPDQQQYEALCRYFAEEFRKWKITCAAATTAVQDDVQYPPSNTHFEDDRQEAVLRAERQAEQLQAQMNIHLQAVYQAWHNLPVQRQQETWLLEMARNVGTKQKEIETLNETQHKLRQENENLRNEIATLNRLQHPREFKIMPPATFPTSQKFLNFLLEEGVVHGRRGIGFNMDSRHEDIGAVVTAGIERWKNVIISTRAQQGGMNAQRTLDQPGPVTPASENVSAGPPNTTTGAQGQLHAPASVNQPPHVNYQASNTAAPPAISITPTAPPTGTTTPSAPASVNADMNGEEQEDEEEDEEEDDDMSDQDADAEMEEDDEYSNPPPPSAVPQPPAVPSVQDGQLNVPRIRGTPVQQQQQQQQRWATQQHRSFTHAGHGGRGGMMDLSRAMPMQGAHAHPGIHQDGHVNQGGMGSEMYVDN